MERYGIDITSREQVGISFRAFIQQVDPLIHSRQDLPFVAPGFIDLQVNGFAGVDYNNPAASSEEIARSLRVQFATGVTRVFPTIITGPAEDMASSLANLARTACETTPEGQAMEGFHVEGPHISPEDGPRGAHPKECVRAPDINEYRRWQEAAQGYVKLVTVSPEWPEITKYIETLVADGVVVSIGHTQATTQQIEDAVRAGASMSTHLGNGAHSMVHRFPNYIWDQLADDRLNAGFIVDGIHSPEAYVRCAVRAKGPERAVLVTDAVMPAGCEPGRYRLGTVDVQLHAPGDRVTLVGQERLAGSALRMDRGIENLVKLARIPIGQAIAMATRNPARAGRIADRQKGLTPGERADLVEFDWDDKNCSLTVQRTYLNGELVFDAESAGAD